MALAVLAISTGAALGALLRWFLGSALNALWTLLPLGTLAANLLGGLLIGVADELLANRPGIAPEWRLAVITGFLGGLTTFSTFSLEIATSIESRRITAVIIETGLHLIGSVGLTLAGIWIVQMLCHGPDQPGLP